MAPKQLTAEKPLHTRTLNLPGGRKLELSRPLVMGVLNVTPDSFSDGGQFVNVDAAIQHALAMINEGADIIDIGGESTRPGADPVKTSEEIVRVEPVIAALRRESDICISIDTYKSSTARAALKAGADMVNDISALRMDSMMPTLLAESDVPVVLMHMKGEPKNMQASPVYDNCVDEIKQFFGERLAFCQEFGIVPDRIVLDPGIGFGKRLEDNLQILSSLDQFVELGQPILIGASRKSFINRLHQSNNPADSRLGGSVAAALAAVERGAAIVRVHDVAATVEALKVAEAINKSRSLGHA